MNTNINMKRFDTLLDAYVLGTISQDELKELLSMLNDPEATGRLEQLVDSQLTNHFYDQDIELTDVYERLTVRLQSTILEKPARVRPMQRTWLRVAVAAVFAGLMATTGWFVLRDHKAYQQVAITHADVTAPATNHARITLANGQTVYLDSAMNGKLATVGYNIGLVKLADGQIAYAGSNEVTPGKIEYNTISNPRGSKVIDLGFVDGSHVWLNAGSSITYPVPFEGNERKVTINGEAYFEIAHNTAKPFKVAKGNMEVTVLGTHFNVNAFDDEKDIKVTLLQGSVKVTKDGSEGMLKPGQQALITNHVSIMEGVDLKQVMAWRTGQFSFDNTTIQTLMRQIARWYDVEVIYEKNMPEDGFNGITTRNENLSEVLKVLELNGGVHFRVEGTRVYVRP